MGIRKGGDEGTDGGTPTPPPPVVAFQCGGGTTTTPRDTPLREDRNRRAMGTMGPRIIRPISTCPNHTVFQFSWGRKRREGNHLRLEWDSAALIQLARVVEWGSKQKHCV